MDDLTADRRVAVDGPFDLLLLQILPGVGPVTVRRLVERFGSAAGALAAPSDAFAAVAGRPAAAARRDRALRARVPELLDRARSGGADVRSWSDPEYPQALLRLPDPPPTLFLRGRTDLLRGEARVTVVGARRATRRGRETAERLGAALSLAGVTVVSGLALGIDGAAHQGAMGGTGSTIAVLGSGTDVPYPATHRRLFDGIGERGLLLSEFPPGTGAAPHHFPRRNRVLAALSATTVVVEAGSRSGALITVDHALDLGRDVWAVPGPIDAPSCRGSNRLLADGARALVSIESFVRESVSVHASTGSADASIGRPAEGPPCCADGAGRHDDLPTRILGALSTEGALAADELAGRLALEASSVLAALTVLEIHGEVERLPGMRFRCAA